MKVDGKLSWSRPFLNTDLGAGHIVRSCVPVAAAREIG
jgi:hypothetical protein